MIYIFPISLLYIYLALDSPDFRYSNLFYLLISILGVISIFRGAVGVDTINYEFIVKIIRSSGSLLITEPGFAIIVRVLSNLFDSDMVVVRMLTLVYVALTIIYFMKADKNEKYFLISYMIPAFYFIFSMNTTRIGLAAMIFILCVQHANKLKGEHKLWTPFISIFFHYSMLFSGFYRLASIVRWRLKHSIFAALILLCFAYLIFLNTGYFLQKWIEGEGIQSPSRYSGLSQMLISSLLLVGLLQSKVPKQRKIQLIVISSGLMILFYYVSQFSYNGLRALQLISLVLPIIILNFYQNYNLRFGLSVRICLFFSGLISFAAFFRNIYIDNGIGVAPFLPYKSVFF
jgi:hypothetical protein